MASLQELKNKVNAIKKQDKEDFKAVIKQLGINKSNTQHFSQAQCLQVLEFYNTPEIDTEVELKQVEEKLQAPAEVVANYVASLPENQLGMHTANRNEQEFIDNRKTAQSLENKSIKLRHRNTEGKATASAFQQVDGITKTDATRTLTCRAAMNKAINSRFSDNITAPEPDAKDIAFKAKGAKTKIKWGSQDASKIQTTHFSSRSKSFTYEGNIVSLHLGRNGIVTLEIQLVQEVLGYDYSMKQEVYATRKTPIAKITGYEQINNQTKVKWSYIDETFNEKYAGITKKVGLFLSRMLRHAGFNSFTSYVWADTDNLGTGLSRKQKQKLRKKISGIIKTSKSATTQDLLQGMMDSNDFDGMKAYIVSKNI